MKQTTKMSRAVSQLEHIYNTLNTDFFGGELPTPIITVQSKPGTYGHCSTAKIWQRPDGQTYELNIAAEVLNAPIEETLDTMLHEMSHLYCRKMGIKDTSGHYHNSNFKAETERRGLVCYKTEKYGWNTKPSDKLVEYALSKGWNEIRICRCDLPRFSVSPDGQPVLDPQGRKRPSSTRKLVCFGCGQSVRATRKVNILCGDCLLPMVEA